MSLSISILRTSAKSVQSHIAPPEDSWHGQPSPWHRLGVRPPLNRRFFARRFGAGCRPAQRECCLFLEAAVAYFTELGIRVERVTTDNGKQLINAPTLILMVIVCLYQCAYILFTASAHSPSDNPDAAATAWSNIRLAAK